MSESFEQLLSRLSQDYSLFQNIEEAVRQAAVLPILTQLGWDTGDLRAVSPEFKVGNGRVDYCLKLGEKKAVFLEVKCLIEDLEKHEKQLLEYSFTDGVDIAVLTNGLLWWFYLPLAKGNWNQRRFFAIDIKQQESNIATQHFREFLSYDSISSGSALRQAKSLQASKEKSQLINKTIPKAWDKLVGEPDELLIELLAEKVESMCGHRPDLQQLATFIQNVFNKTIQPFQTIHNRKPSTPKIPRVSVGAGLQGNRIPRQRGIILDISGQKFNASSVRDLYTKVLQFLYENNHLQKLKPYIPYATSRKRYLISTTPIHPQGNRFVIPIEYKGYYMETHKSYQIAVKCLTNLLGLISIAVHEKQ